MKSIKDLIQPHLLKLAPYSSARDEFAGTASVFLDANENPYGDPNGNDWNRYPDPHHLNLRQKLAQLKQVEPQQIFVGNGSDEAIELLIRLFCRPGQDNILITSPTYGMYKVSAGINNVEIIEVSLREDFQLNPDALLAAVTENTKLIFLCSPNNPTGNLLYAEDVQQVLDSFKGMVVVDEAYIDYAQSQSWVTKLVQNPNLVVLQTFSKAWGMAALRIGVAYASPEVVGYLNKIKPPYNVNAYTQQQALMALENSARKDAMVEEGLQERQQLANDLSALSLVEKIYPSDANFILIKVKEADALYEYLINQQIVVRNRSKVHLCQGCLRITVGTPEENKALISALSSY